MKMTKGGLITIIPAHESSISFITPISLENVITLILGLNGRDRMLTSNRIIKKILEVAPTLPVKEAAGNLRVLMVDLKQGQLRWHDVNYKWKKRLF